MRLPVKLQQVKLRARPQSSVSFRTGDPSRNEFRLRGAEPVSVAWRSGAT